MQSSQMTQMTFVTLTALSCLFVQPCMASNDYDRVNKLVTLPYPVTVTSDGTVKADKAKWTIEKEGDGTELYTSVKTPQCKIAALRNSNGLESFTSFALKAENKDSRIKPESSSSVFFDKGKLSAVTVCEDSGDKDSLGRTCITATPKLCQTLHNAGTVGDEIIKEIDSFEMRALATILTLRGPDHQLDNVVRSGNRLGLKSALQTTKGQLLALARQIAKETTKEGSKETAVTDKKAERGIASESSASKTEKSIVVSSSASKAELENDARTRSQLEHSIPLLKQTCVDSGFMM